MKKVLIFLLSIVTLPVAAQHHHDRKVEFPDIPGYHTLKCDFHQHTVFSDGSVWPNIRVQEAVKDGLDAISITDHIEYQPHKDDIPHKNRNRSYEVAKDAAGSSDLIIIRGSEITRDMPPGHANAIFLTDANKLLVKKAEKAFKEAKEQGAFIFWNHPNWIAQRPDGMATLTDMHKTLISEGMLHGVEVVNDVTYSDEALQIALDYDLTIMGTSDIHGLIDWQYHVPHGGHRPVTLVFAKEHTAESIKEALFAKRTAVWFKNTLIGREAFLVPLIQGSVRVKSAKYLEKSTVLALTLDNLSDAEFIMANGTGYTLHRNSDVFTVKPNGQTTIYLKTVKKLDELELKLTVLNAVTAPNRHPEVIWKVSVD